MEAPAPLKRSLVERLVRYCHFMQGEGGEPVTVSSARIAEFADLDESQVRKDLSAIGVRGRPRVGYKCEEVLERIHDALGFGLPYGAVLAGAGQLGGALVRYEGFHKYGLSIQAIVDNDTRKTGSVIGGLVVQPVERLGEIVAGLGLRLGILTVPSSAAQEMADRLVCAGVQAIWNFAPARVSVPATVHVRHEHLSVGLAELAYQLKLRGAAPEPGTAAEG